MPATEYMLHNKDENDLSIDNRYKIIIAQYLEVVDFNVALLIELTK